MSNEPIAFRQLCDKPNANEIASMCWSPTRDLVAVLTIDGEVRLHRLYWGKVWSYTEKDSKVMFTAWSPDGKVLALGILNGLVRLLEIEKCKSLHFCDTGSTTTSMEWIETQEHDMSLLLVGNENGSIKLFVNGLFEVTSINETDGLEPPCGCVLNLFMSKSLKSVVSVHMDEGEGSIMQPRYFKFHKFKLISSRTKEVKMVAAKYEEIDALLQQLAGELSQISDSWENNLHKVSLKLEKLAEILPEDTTVLEEFLMAFACGTLSAELQSFLINELTMKGLKNLGADINSSYGDVKTKVGDNLQTLCDRMTIELSELLGMARWYDKYGILGLTEVDVQDSLKYLGKFVLKTRELLSVIERDLRSFRAFFKWLSGVMYRISDEPIPGIFKEFNQEENACILEFLQTQLVKSENQKSFVLDRVGQYLKEDEQSLAVMPSNNPWYKFIQEEPSLRDHPLVITPESETSLVLMSRQLQEKVTKIFEKVTLTMTESFTSIDGPSFANEDDDHEEFCRPKLSWSQRQADGPIVSCILPCSCKSNFFYKICLDEEDPANFHVSKLSVDLADFPIQECDDVGETIIKDIQFYNDDNMTLLLAGMDDSDSEPVHVLAQLDMSSLGDVAGQPILNSSLPVTNVTNLISKWRFIESFEPFSFSVSGTRKVSCLLSSNKRRVRIYDMDADEDEETDQSDDENQLEDM